jgi:hypothetical protein
MRAGSAKRAALVDGATHGAKGVDRAVCGAGRGAGGSLLGASVGASRGVCPMDGTGRDASGGV